MSSRQTINDSDREDWILNDEGLYNMQRRSGQSMRNFIRSKREGIDEAIKLMRDGKKPVHFLKCGG